MTHPSGLFRHFSSSPSSSAEARETCAAETSNPHIVSSTSLTRRVAIPCVYISARASSRARS